MNRKLPIKGIGIFPLFLIFTFWTWVSDAHAWWNEQWRFRKKIQFNTTVTGADINENLQDFPVLVRLHSGNFNFSNAKEDGSDIRFVSADDQTALKFHMERFDPLDEMAFLWVKIPRIAGTSTLDSVWMYYGNEAAAGGQDMGGTYDINTIGVYHMGEIEGSPRDSTAFENHPSQFDGGLGLPGIIGTDVALSGGSQKILIPNSPSLELKTGFTFSAWLRTMGPQNDAYLFFRGSEEHFLVIGMDGTKVYARIAVGGEGEKEDKEEPGTTTFETEESVEIPLENWHHITVTAEPKGRLSLYLDGVEMTWTDLPIPMPEFKEDMVIGNAPEGDHGFVGELDEVNISNIARRGAWIRATVQSQGPETPLISFGLEEVTEAKGFLPTFYLATVVKNVTLDGWVIIGILVLFAVISWLIFLSKAFTLILVGKDNRAFLKSFEEVEDVTALASEEDQFGTSSLYRVYQEGCRFLERWQANPEPEREKKRLSVKEMNAFKASLEKAYSLENQRLNARLVILTMAITGGPFLGLLGTVWGVMNTFAAMAEAGEASIMAIAPGVASALSTTVFGLIVAIPALFSYNYLANRIRTITADLDIFIDTFTIRIDGQYGATP
jgi:biopolymer transport protein ExbB